MIRLLQADFEQLKTGPKGKAHNLQNKKRSYASMIRIISGHFESFFTTQWQHR
ncbi:hypothetical protein SAMN05216302_101259 [Nitrosomonas aestuarii]|uniref:Uncharacterized protein n=1 Tax=Nitrosomonas aestuarii TaxID=52441 RepID=A0A1I4BKT7_9PROT|nr:hypothetical protein SAMN05216302_101259 [Nitrosomonas aestuarii]